MRTSFIRARARAICAVALAAGLMSLSVGVSLAQTEDETESAALAALATNNWSAVYAMLDSDAKFSQTERQFKATMTAGLPEFFDAAIDGEVEHGSLFGDSIAVVPVALSAHGPDGNVVSYRLKMKVRDGKSLLRMQPPFLLRSLDDVTQQVLQAVSANDWAAFYGLMSREFKKSTSESEFTSRLPADLPLFFDAQVAGPAVEDHILGETLTTIPISLLAHAIDGGVQTYTTDLKIVEGEVVGFKTPTLVS